MAGPLQERTLALAGIYQAARLAKEAAYEGRRITPAVEASIHSLFKLDAADTLDVFGGLNGLETGLETLRAQLGPARGAGRDLDITRYAIALLFLERKLVRRPELVQQLKDGVVAATEQASYFEQTHPNVIARLGELYRTTVGTLKPRILVRGEPRILSDADNAALIRALLLAGIRSAVLWRQRGGNRLLLIFQRRAVVEAADELLREISRGRLH